MSCFTLKSAESSLNASKNCPLSTRLNKTLIMDSFSQLQGLSLPHFYQKRELRGRESAQKSYKKTQTKPIRSAGAHGKTTVTTADFNIQNRTTDLLKNILLYNKIKAFKKRKLKHRIHSQVPIFFSCGGVGGVGGLLRALMKSLSPAARSA